MPTENDLPGTALPLPQPVQDAINDFNQPVNLYQAMRAAAALVLFQDMVEDVRKMLKDRGDK